MRRALSGYIGPDTPEEIAFANGVWVRSQQCGGIIRARLASIPDTDPRWWGVRKILEQLANHIESGDQ